MEAIIILAKCPKTHLMYGIRAQKINRDWWRTWAFPINEYRARREGYDITTVEGSLCCTMDYPGCPYCKYKGFVQCYECHKLSCWDGKSHMVCPWCGMVMDNIITSTDFTISGGDI